MKKWMINTLIVVFATVFLISAAFLIGYYVDAWQQKADFDELAALVEQARKDQIEGSTDPTADTQPENTESEETGPVLVQVTDPDTGEGKEVLVDYAELYTRNSDMVGWMSIEGTNINYPVMQNKDILNYYLYRDFSEEYSNSGCLYAREACDVDTPSDNITIYGHNMKNTGTMYHQLHNYIQKSFWEEHQYIRFDTLSEYHTYQIIAVFKTSADVGEGFDYHLFVNAANEAEFDEFVDTCKELSFYDTGLTASYGDKLITLSTCEYTLSNGRLVVVAKRID